MDCGGIQSIWNNVAVLTIMYGADVVAITDEAIGDLDVQNQLVKALLGPPVLDHESGSDRGARMETLPLQGG